MKLLLISSSPHGEKSNTFALAKEVLKGCSGGENHSQITHLCDLNVFFCRHCEACHRKILHCSLKDGAPEFINKMIEADGIILASPNYINQITASLKALMERSAHFIHCKRLLGKYIVAVVSSGSGYDKDVLGYIEYYAHACGAQYSGGVSSRVPLAKEKMEEAYRLGARLASDIKEKKEYPGQIAQIEEGRRYFGEIIRKRKDEWVEEYKYWQGKGWL